MKKHLKQSGKRGFSMVELLLTLLLFGLAAAAGYSMLRTTVIRLDGIVDRAGVKSDEAIAFAVIARDIRAAYLSADDNKTFFSGHAGNEGPVLRFTRLSKNGHGAVEEVEYGPRFSGTGVEFRYFDGDAWQKNWGWDDENRRPYEGIRGLPIAVSVQIHETKIVVPVMTAVLNRNI